MAIENRLQTRKEYSFKSVGLSKRKTDKIVERALRPVVGIKTPITLSSSDGIFSMHRDIADQISDNLKNLILTNHGERLGFYDFGANIKPLVFNLGSDDADLVAIERIGIAVGKYMPFVTLDNFQVYVDRFDNKEVAKVGIVITYLIPAIDKLVRKLEVMLYVGG